MSEAHRIALICVQLTEASEVRQLDRLKPLLKYAKFLVDDSLLTNADPELIFSTLRKAKEMAEAIHDQQGLADALSLLGQGRYFAMLNAGIFAEKPPGQFGDSLDLQKQALEIREAIQDTRGISESHFFIGQIHERWQNIEQALEHHVTAIRIAELHEHLFERTEPTRHLAFLSFQSGNLDQALTYALEALSFREESGFKPYLPLDHRLLCDIYLKMGDIGNALHHARKAVSISEEMEYKGAIASSFLGVGDVYAARNEDAQARVYYERSLELAQELHHALFAALAGGRLERLPMQ